MAEHDVPAQDVVAVEVDGSECRLKCLDSFTPTQRSEIAASFRSMQRDVRRSVLTEMFGFSSADRAVDEWTTVSRRRRERLGASHRVHVRLVWARAVS